MATKQVETTETSLPPLPDTPSAERIRELAALLDLVSNDFDELEADLSSLESPGYGEREFKRQLELEAKAERSTEEQAELETLEACAERSRNAPPPVSFELAGLLAVVCDQAISDANAIREKAEEIRKEMPWLTSFYELPASGYRQVYEERAAMYERRAAEARAARAGMEAEAVQD